jgi:hypothetical protein
MDLITKCWVHLLEIAYKGIEDTKLVNLLFAEASCIQFRNGVAAFVAENIGNPLLGFIHISSFLGTVYGGMLNMQSLLALNCWWSCQERPTPS